MIVKDYMRKDAISVSPSTGLMDIYLLFKKHHIGGAPVVDKDNKVIGLITRNELLAAILPDYFDMIGEFLFIDDFGALEEELENLPEFKLFLAEDLMVRNVVTVSEESSLLKVPALMDKYKINRVPVVDKENRLRGVISKMDLCHAYFNHNDEKAEG